MLRILETLQKIYAYKMLEHYSTQKERLSRNIHDMSLIWHSRLKPLASFLSTHFPAQEDWAGLTAFHPCCRNGRSWGAEFPRWQLLSPVLPLQRHLLNLQQKWLITLPLLSKTFLFGSGRLIYKNISYKFELLSFTNPLWLGSPMT